MLCDLSFTVAQLVVASDCANQRVVGSSPTCGAIFWARWSSEAKTPPFHGGKHGFELVRVTI